jgi:hypothetical protein
MVPPPAKRMQSERTYLMELEGQDQLKTLKGHHLHKLHGYERNKEGEWRLGGSSQDVG